MSRVAQSTPYSQSGVTSGRSAILHAVTRERFLRGIAMLGRCYVFSLSFCSLVLLTADAIVAIVTVSYSAGQVASDK